MTTRESVNIIDAFHQLGSYRAAARLLGTTHKTVRRAVERQRAGGPWSRRPLPKDGRRLPLTSHH